MCRRTYAPDVDVAFVARAISALAESSSLARLRSKKFFCDDRKIGFVQGQSDPESHESRIGDSRCGDPARHRALKIRRLRTTMSVSTECSQRDKRLSRTTERIARPSFVLRCPKTGRMTPQAFAQMSLKRRLKAETPSIATDCAEAVGQRPSFALSISFTACGLALPPDDFIT